VRLERVSKGSATPHPKGALHPPYFWDFLPTFRRWWPTATKFSAMTCGSSVFLWASHAVLFGTMRAHSLRNVVRKCLQWRPRMLTRDLFAVADLLVGIRLGIGCFVQLIKPFSRQYAIILYQNSARQINTAVWAFEVYKQRKIYDIVTGYITNIAKSTGSTGNIVNDLEWYLKITMTYLCPVPLN